MKRILLAAIISLGLHGLLFSMETEWLSGINPAMPESREITISLTHLRQIKPEIKPSQKQKSIHVLKKNTLKKQVKPPDIQKEETAVEPESIPDSEELEPDKETKEEYFDPAPDMSYITSSTTFDQKVKTPDAQTILEARPIYRINPPPSYPIIARKRGYQGNVVLEVLIDKRGKVLDLKIFSSSGHSILDKTAISSVKKWLFEPGMRGSDKIEMWVRVPIRFKLN
ncbi:MAG: energy transducer TonB [Thermodesulfobacteriota bacterium]|nr:energy transducer TonB [Thermodesulfobacteriota bacterium]